MGPYFTKYLLTNNQPKSNIKEDISYKESLCRFAKNKNYIFLSMTYAMIIGIGIVVYTALTSLLSSYCRHTESISVGVMGFLFNISVLMLFVLLARIFCKNSNYNASLIFLIDSSFIIWAVFTILAIQLQLKTAPAVFGVNMIHGAVIQSFTSSCMEQAEEMRYPAPERTSAMVMTFLSNGFICAGIFALGGLAKADYIQTVAYMISGLFFVASVLLLSIKTKHRRLIDIDNSEDTS